MLLLPTLFAALAAAPMDTPAPTTPLSTLHSPLSTPHPFTDALILFHLADLTDSISRTPALTPVGKVATNVELTGPEAAASRARGGDARVARFDGGYLDAAQGPRGNLNLKAAAFTLCARLRDPAGAWMAPLFSKHGGHDQLVFNLFSHDFGAGKVIGFELGAQRSKGMTQVTCPLALIGPTDWHDVIARYDGAKLQLFIDGVWMDEGFPMGPLREGNREPVLLAAESVAGKIKSGWRGLIDHLALWPRALTDAEITALSGGPAEVAARKARYLGPTPSPQYWRPHNQFNVGDTLPFFHDGTFHFYYLLDRGHHSAKGGQGAHQWAHLSSRDLKTWTEHPFAVPITAEHEGSICTGSVFHHAGTYYAFYATRIPGKGEFLSLATSPDGVAFTKTQPNPFLSPGPQYTGGFRDPHVFREAATGTFHLLVSTMLKEGKRGCLAHYTSPDLKAWTETAPFHVEGGEVPECPDYFPWNGWYYLIFSHGQVARYRMSRHPLGPWQRPPQDLLDGPAARVIKTAAFTGNRRLATASIWPHGYAGWALFRELVQHDDGTLGARFVPELVPATADPIPLTLSPLGPGASGDTRALRLHAPEGTAQATLTNLPANARIQLRLSGKAAAFGLRLRAGADPASGHELRLTPADRKVALAGGQALTNVAGLDAPFTLDLILKDHLLDLCLGNRRTLINWLPTPRGGDRLVLFVERGQAAIDQLTIQPLK